MEKQSFLKSWGIIILMSLLKLAIHLLTSTNYGLHRDEYLYLAQGDHLALGYTSVPPSIAYFAWLIHFFSGTSVFAVRLIPSLLGALVIFLTMMMVKEMGGKGFAQFLAGLAIILNPLFLRTSNLFMPVPFDVFYWTLITYFVFRFITTHNPNYILMTGTIAGIALLNKYLILLLIFSIITGLLLTKYRKVFKTHYAYLAFLIAFLIFLPNLLWQYHHHFPVLFHMKELMNTQLVNVSKINFLSDQVVYNYTSSIFWIGGLIFLFFNKDGSKYRIIGWMYITIIIVLLLLNGKSYYSIGIYPALIAAGAYFFEKISIRWLKYSIRSLLVVIIMVFSIVSLPVSLHLLSPEKLESYCRMLIDTYGLESPMRWEDGKIHAIPQDYADMFGWEELASMVICTYQQLPENEKQSCFIYADNYGEAGSIDYWGKSKDLPAAISLCDNYALWAPDSISGKNGIIITGKEDMIPENFIDFQLIGSITNKYAREYGVCVYLVKHPKDEFYIAWGKKLQNIRWRK